jgi:hypothetical protein
LYLWGINAFWSYEKDFAILSAAGTSAGGIRPTETVGFGQRTG